MNCILSAVGGVGVRGSVLLICGRFGWLMLVLLCGMRWLSKLGNCYLSTTV